MSDLRPEALGGARLVAGEDYDRKSTVYFLGDGRVKRGDELSKSVLANLPSNTRVLLGYVFGGYVTAKRSAFDICGKRWNFPSTIYRFEDGSIRAGNEMKEGGIPKNTLIFFQN